MKKWKLGLVGLFFGLALAAPAMAQAVTNVNIGAVYIGGCHAAPTDMGGGKG